MSIFSKIGKFAAALFVGIAMTATAADDIYPPLDTDLNDFDPTVPVGRYIQQISSNTVNEVVILTNGVLTVGGESINIAEETNEVYKSAVAYVDGATNEIGSIIRPLQVIPELIPDQTSPSNQLADKAWVDEKVESVAAYYITADAEGNAFESYAALANTTVYYSGGVVRVPTRNDYAVVLADETHGGTEWRYIYAVPDGASSGQWEAQYPIETNDYEALSNKPEINGHTLTNNQTGADLGLLDLAGGTMTGPLSTPQVNVTRFGYPTWSIELHADAGDFHIKAPPMGEGSEGLGSVSVFLPRKIGKNISGTVALAAPNPTAGNLAALDVDGNPINSGLSTTNVVMLAYDVNSNRTAVTVGVPRQNDPSSEVDTSAVDEATGRFITVPEVVGPHSVAITGGEDEESDPSERTVASGEGAIAANKGVATNRFSVALGSHTFAAGEAAVSHGYETAALGSHSHSEGISSYAHGACSHAEGGSTFAFGDAAHAEGYGSEAHGDYSHAEGYGSEARGAYSHAAGFGSQTTAEAWYAHSDGIGTRATNHTAYVWQGATGSLTGTSNPAPTVRGLYYSHGLGTYNINPNGGLAGFWVGETNLEQHVANLTAGKLGKSGGTMTGPLFVNTEDNYAVMLGSPSGFVSGDGIWWAEDTGIPFSSACGIYCASLMGNLILVSEGNEIYLPNRTGSLALLSDIYTAVQQIAPDFTAKAYARNDLCTYDGVVYRCKSGYTATASSAKPDKDTTHWEAKKVSELFLPLTGGEMTGDITFDGGKILSDPSGLRIFDYNGRYWSFYANGENTVARLGDVDGKTSTNDVKTIVRNILHINGLYVFDESSSICYRRVNTNDFIVLHAVTNIDLTAEENYEALDWMEEHWREIVFPSESQVTEKNPDENVETAKE